METDHEDGASINSAVPTPSKVGIAAERLRDFESEEIDWEGSVTYYVRDAGGKVLAVYKRGLHVPTDEDDCWPQDFSLTPFNDQDGDGVDDASTPNPSLPGPPPGQTQRDNCPPMPTPPVVPYGMPINPWQEDSDADGIGDACDPYPLDPSQPMGALAGGKPLYIRAPYRAWIESSDHIDIKLAELHIYGNAAQGRIAMYRPKTKRNTEYIESFAGDGGVFVRTLQRKEYEMKDHLGNVRLVISDLKEVVTAGSEWMVDVQSTNEYYPFGMLQPGRSWQAKEYRYGFNGKEIDNENVESAIGGKSGLGGSCDYGARVYNPLIAKFLSVDPLSSTFPWYTPYQYAGNTPIQSIDLDGLEEFHYTFVLDPVNGEVSRTEIGMDFDASLGTTWFVQFGEDIEMEDGMSLLEESGPLSLPAPRFRVHSYMSVEGADATTMGGFVRID